MIESADTSERTTSNWLQAPEAERRTRRPRLILVMLLVGSAWIAVGAAVRPLQVSCDPALARDACLETVDAALRRGLPPVHPLLLAAHAEPGPAARPDQLGHRATVTFDLLGVPGPVSVRLFFDAGGHWGGIADRGAAELALWVLPQGAVAAAVAGWLWRRLRSHRPGDEPTATST